MRLRHLDFGSRGVPIQMRARNKQARVRLTAVAAVAAVSAGVCAYVRAGGEPQQQEQSHVVSLEVEFLHGRAGGRGRQVVELHFFAGQQGQAGLSESHQAAILAAGPL